MQNHAIYALTGRGQDELHRGATTLSPTELELLIRIDGVLTIGQIEAAIPAMSSETFLLTFQRLLDGYLVTVAEVDPFAEQFDIQFNRLDLSLAEAEAEADAGAKSLKKAGYYVSIARQRGSARPLAPGELLSVVVVEDEPNLAKFIQSYLAFEGFHVRLACNRAEVIAEFRKTPIPNLVLLDVMLPDADGFDILQRMRQHPALKTVPVIMMTGKSTREAVIKGLTSGADGYITKPFEADALMRAVRTVVGLPEEPKPKDPWVNSNAGSWKS